MPPHNPAGGPPQVPVDVSVVGQPVQVEFTPGAVPPGASKAPTTTAQEDLTTAGQRRVNIIWETTQAAITILITMAAIYCAVRGIDADVLNFAFVAVISTYYARTNHTKVGGVLTGQTGR